MTMAATIGPNVQRAPTAPLRFALVIMALIATCEALLGLPLAFRDFGQTTPLVIDVKPLVAVKLIAAPLVALIALVLAIVGRARGAITALAVLMLLSWVAQLAINAFELSGGIFNATTFGERVALPSLAITAIALAVRNTHLVLATVFVAIAWLLSLLEIAIFAVAVAIYGF